MPRAADRVFAWLHNHLSGGNHKVRSWIRREYRASPSDLKQDAVAAVPAAMSGIADGMGSGILAGVNPMYGLYAAIAGQTAGALMSSSRFMTINTTSATALAASGAIAAFSADTREEALLVLTLAMGLTQITTGLLRLGSLTRFVSDAVMAGFLTGVAILIILGQLGNATGYHSEESNKVAQAADLLRHLGKIDTRTLITAAIAFALAMALPRTRLRSLGIVFALLIPTMLVAIMGWEGVVTVGDEGAVAGGLPAISLPDLSLLNVDLITAAFAVAAIGLVQGAGVAQKFPNPDGTLADSSQDFSAQGVGNVAASMFSGMPVGGSVGATGLNISAGAKTRWANVFCAVTILVMIVLLSDLVSTIAMAALAGLLITVGLSIVDPQEALSIWRVGWPSRIAILSTFLATLVTPIQVAVGLGVSLSAILYLYQASNKIKIVERRRLPDGSVEELDAPAILPSNTVTFLDVYGSLFYAGAYVFERALPSPMGAANVVVVLRLRGQTNIGITFINGLARYAVLVAATGGRLYLTGISNHFQAQITRSGKLSMADTVSMYTASRFVGESSEHALTDADVWLAEHISQAAVIQPIAPE